MAEHNQQFDSFQEWVDMGRYWLTTRQRTDSNDHPYNRAVCFDTKGRLVECGGDFMRAHDEDAFPVRWLWPEQIAEIGNQHPFFSEAACRQFGHIPHRKDVGDPNCIRCGKEIR